MINGAFSDVYLENIEKLEAMEVPPMEKMLFHTIFSVQEFSRNLRPNIPLMDMSFSEVVTAVEMGKN